MTDMKQPSSSVTAFTEALHGEQGALAAWLEANDEREVVAHIEAYARANVAVATAALRAEIDRLRADVEDYRTNGAAAVKFAPGSAYWSDELCRLFGDDARTGIRVLESRYQQERARAEQLEEALRELEERKQRDEVLMQRALEALERGAWDTLSGRNAAFAIRARLGLKQEE